MIIGNLSKSDAKSKADFYLENSLKIQTTDAFLSTLGDKIKAASEAGDMSVDVPYDADNMFSSEVIDFIESKGYKTFRTGDNPPYTLTISWR